MKDFKEVAAKGHASKGGGTGAGTGAGTEHRSGEGTSGDSHSGADSRSDGRSGEGVSVQPEVQARIGDKLKEVYSDVLNAPVPDRFTELLAQLESSNADKASKGKASEGGNGG